MRIEATATGQAGVDCFQERDLELKGFVWTPDGTDPFQILWNHGDEKLPGTVDTVAPYFVSRGYVLLVSHWRGQGRSTKAALVVRERAIGDIQTMLAVERGPGYRVAVDCSGGVR